MSQCKGNAVKTEFNWIRKYIFI